MFKIHTEYPETWETMLEDCKSAKSYIYFEQFIWQDIFNSGIGKQFEDVFRAKAKEGVEVKIIADAVGSIALATSPLWRQELLAEGVEIVLFGVVPKWGSRFPFNMFHRDHRKIIVIDDRIAHVGGVIVGERARDWHDIDARIEDPKYIKEIKGAFLRMWDEIKGTKEYLSAYDINNGTILKNDPENNDMYRMILKKVKTASKKIVIITPYFSPNFRMVRALKKACKRGVTVDIILPLNCDSGLTAMVNASYVQQFQRSKINMHFFFTCMNHGKLVMIDDWATLGSMNFDRLSFFYNRELNIVLTEDLSEVERVISNIKNNSNLIGKSYFKKMTLWEKVKAEIGWFFRPVA